MHIPIADLGLDGIWVVHPGTARYALAAKIEAIGIGELRAVLEAAGIGRTRRNPGG